MSISVVDATVTKGPNLRLRRADNRAKRTVAVMLLAAAAFAANLADAAASNRASHSGASMSQRSWVSHYAPSDYGRYHYRTSAPSRVGPEPAHNEFPRPENEFGG